MKNFLIITFALFLIYNVGYAQLEVGDKAPAFSAKDDSNKSWNSSDYIGAKNLIVYFYPAAMTGGCTKQACAFRDDKSKLDGVDAIVVGISGDEVENLKYFKEAYDLNFPLLADTNGKIAEKFGVFVKDGGSIKRTIGGNELTLTRGVTTSRWTFIIDKKGKIVYKNTEVNAAEDSKETLAILGNL